MYAKLTGNSAEISSFIFSQLTDPYDVEPDGDFQRFGGRRELGQLQLGSDLRLVTPMTHHRPGFLVLLVQFVY